MPAFIKIGQNRIPTRLLFVELSLNLFRKSCYPVEVAADNTVRLIPRESEHDY